MEKPQDPIESKEEIIFPREIKEYQKILKRFDAVVCEAMAIGQEHAGRLAAPHVSYATRVFSRMCSQAVSAIRAVPLSRWGKSDFQNWDFGCIAGHTRAIMDGFLLFSYLAVPGESDDENQARIDIMNLNDCTRRQEFFKDLGDSYAESSDFDQILAELKYRLNQNPFFINQTTAIKKQCLNGKFLTTESKETLIKNSGFSIGAFNSIYNLCSQNIHCLPMSFYRMEPNGRGTGMYNEADLAYIGAGMQVAANLLDCATETLIYTFPDIGHVRNGVKSKFEPGPRENRRHTRKH